jgi:hypothetical protein
MLQGMNLTDPVMPLIEEERAALAWAGDLKYCI